MVRTRSFFAVSVLWVGTLAAQDPSRDLPAERRATRGDRECVELGIARLRTGWNWEAARLFRELVERQPERPLGHLLLALAYRAEPVRAARFCWEAVERRAAAGPEVRALVDAYQRYFGVEEQPEIVDRRFAEPPPAARAQALIETLGELAARAGDRGLASALRDHEAGRDGDRTGDEPGDLRTLLRRHHGYLDRGRAMPFLVPGYRALVERVLELDDELIDDERRARLARIPRHPSVSEERRIVAGLPGEVAEGGLEWEPRRATSFDLPRGLGGRTVWDGHPERPTLLVFFLGFG